MEHLVVGGEVFTPGDERGASGPVEVGEVGGVDRGRGGAVRLDVARPDGEAPRPQRPPEPDEDGHHPPHLATSRRGDLVEALAGELQVLPLLEHGAERDVGRVDGQVGLAQQFEGARPVDRLGHPGWLGQLQLTQPVHGGDDAPGQLGSHSRITERDDLDLALRVG